MDITKDKVLKMLTEYSKNKSKIEAHEIKMATNFPSGTAKYGDGVGGGDNVSSTEKYAISRADEQDRIKTYRVDVALIECAYKALPRHLKRFCDCYFFDGDGDYYNMGLSHSSFKRHKKNVVDEMYEILR